MKEIEESRMNHEPEKTSKRGKEKWNQFKRGDELTLNSKISLRSDSKTKSIRQF